jgi:hypothetical protein
MIKIFLTFDYELYFGENFLLEKEVLFEPTDKILEIAQKNNIKLVFFIDIMSIYAYKKNFTTHFYLDEFKKQVKKILRMGHNIEFHFHPHWIDSIYKNNKWNHQSKNWSYSNLIDNYGKKRADKVFDEGYNLFLDIVGKKPTCFRAGGYTIQPYEKELINLLKKYNFKCDSSITPYKKFISEAQMFNFLECENLNFWKISNNTFLKQGNENITEFPILSLKKDIKTLSRYIIPKIIHRLNNEKVNFKKRGRGITIKPKEYIDNSISFNFENVLNKDKTIIKFITNEYIRKFENNNDVYINILNHPKAMFNNSFEIMDWYINYMKKNFKVVFIGFDDIKQ